MENRMEALFIAGGPVVLTAKDEADAGEGENHCTC